MIVSQLIGYVAVLFLSMLPGVILKKCALVPEGFGKGLSNLVLYIAQPVLIVYAYLACESSFSDIWKNALWVLFYSVLAHALFALVSLLFFRHSDRRRAGMLRFVSVFANAAFMGIPLVEAILGAEAAIYASIYNIPFNFFLWTLGVHFCTDEGRDEDKDGDHDLADRLVHTRRQARVENSLIKVLIHPVTLASVVGVLFLCSGVRVATLEGVGLSFLTDTLAMLRALVAPLSMVVIGLRLPEISFRGLPKDAPLWIFIALRHLVLPIGVVLLCKLPALLGAPLSEIAETVIVIMASAPAATSATMFAEKYDCDAVDVSRMVAVSTLLCIATMPLILLLL